MKFTENTKFLDVEDDSFIRTRHIGQNIIFNIENSDYVSLNIETAKEFVKILKLNIDKADNSRLKYNPNNICKVKTK